MTGVDEVIAGLIRTSASVRNPGDYEQNGLLYCGKCHTPKQCVADFDPPLLVGCTCLCEQEKIRTELEEKRKLEHMMHARELRVQGIQDSAVRRYTFAEAEQSQNIQRCQKYAERWDDMLKHNNGLLFWGNIGTGKTFAAACIANAVIDKGTPALMTSFPKILNAGWDKTELTEEMKHFPLLIIDDLGVERESGYSLEIVQFVVDERYKTGKPLIVTTNLTLGELQHPKDMRFSRIYDRVLEMCVPVYFDGPSRREKNREGKMRYAREVFG